MTQNQKNLTMKFSKITRQNDEMAKKGTCISQGKYLEIEQCISLCSYILLIFIDIVVRDDALAKVLGVDARGWCHGVGLGVTPTNLFGKIPNKEALAVSQATVKEKAEESTSLKTTITELLKRVEDMERENVVNKESVSVQLFTLVSVYIFSQ